MKLTPKDICPKADHKMLVKLKPGLWVLDEEAGTDVQAQDLSH